MSLKCGIVGMPNVGKSTLFNSLSNARAQAANVPFCTIEPNIGVITVPDERLGRLAAVHHPERVIPATIEIVDIAGLVRGASKGEGLGNQFLANIRETDLLIHVLRCFDNPHVVHVDGMIDPVRDREIVETELMLKDLETLGNRLDKLDKQAKHGGDQRARRLYDIARQYHALLQQGRPARVLELHEEDLRFAREFFLLTGKPVLYVCNVEEASAKSGNRHVEAVRKSLAGDSAGLLVVAAATEADIAGLDSYEEKQLFLRELGLAEPGVNKLVRTAYQMLDLQTFFTMKKDECRAWTFRRGTRAPQAAGIIHTDFERGFIRAEVIRVEDFIRLGSEAACREAGKTLIEGRDYIVRDGDLLHFRFNV